MLRSTSEHTWNQFRSSRSKDENAQGQKDQIKASKGQIRRRTWHKLKKSINRSKLSASMPLLRIGSTSRPRQYWSRSRGDTWSLAATTAAWTPESWWHCWSLTWQTSASSCGSRLAGTIWSLKASKSEWSQLKTTSWIGITSTSSTRRATPTPALCTLVASLVFESTAFWFVKCWIRGKMPLYSAVTLGTTTWANASRQASNTDSRKEAKILTYPLMVNKVESITLHRCTGAMLSQNTVQTTKWTSWNKALREYYGCTKMNKNSNSNWSSIQTLSNRISIRSHSW